jgi:choline dehydrogenase-like flavoprotein
MSKANKASILRGIQILCECFFAGGAREIYLPIFGSEPIRNGTDIKNKITDGIPARRIECVTFHPLGSSRIALDPRDGVVDPWGKTHELDGVYVADGSVVPTSIGVNSQLTIMAMAARIAWRLRDKLKDRLVTHPRTKN